MLNSTSNGSPSGSPKGGHDVPDDKIRSRYERIFAGQLIAAIEAADEAFLFDTTYGNEQVPEPQFVAHIQGKYVARHHPDGLIWGEKIVQSLKDLDYAFAETGE